MTLVYAVTLVLVCLLGLIIGLFGLPGNWLMVAAAAVYAYCIDDKVPSSMAVWELGDWWVVGGLAALALLGDIIEFLAGALGVKRKGGSKRGALFAIIGSFAGGLVGIFVGIPVPIVGPIIGALLFASLGALAGAMVGEMSKKRDKKEAWQIGKAAFWGRLFGTLSKSFMGALILVVIVVALVF